MQPVKTRAAAPVLLADARVFRCSDDSSDASDKSSKAGGDDDMDQVRSTPRRAASSPTREEQQRQDASEELTESSTDEDDEYRERLERAKKLARSEITVRQWDRSAGLYTRTHAHTHTHSEALIQKNCGPLRRYKFCEIDLDQALGPVLDNLERISCHRCARVRCPAITCIRA